MRLDEIDKYWHLLEAARAGKRLQVKSGEEWTPLWVSVFDLAPENYRVAPEVQEWWVNVYKDGHVGVPSSTKREADIRGAGRVKTAQVYTRIEDGVVVVQELVRV